MTQNTAARGTYQTARTLMLAAAITLAGYGAAMAQQRPATHAPAATPPASAAAQTPPIARPTAPLGTPSGMPALTFGDIVGERGTSTPISLGGVAVGAVAGVVVFNVVTAYFFPGVFAYGAPLAGTVVAESALAASRIYAITSAALGGVAGNWVMTRE